MSEHLRVGLGQMVSGEDVEGNLKQILDLARQAPANTDLLCFPENSLYFRVRKNTPMRYLSLEDSAFRTLGEWVDKSRIAIMLGSVPLKENHKFSNATVFVQPGQKPEVLYQKIHLFDVDVKGHPPVRESDSFQHGEKTKIVEFKTWRFGLSICYDLRFSELYTVYAKERVDAILIPSAFLVPTGKDHWHVLLRARAIESQAYILAAAQGGEHQVEGESRSTFGHSLIADPWGLVVAEADRSPQLILAELRRDRLQAVRAQIPMSSHRRLT